MLSCPASRIEESWRYWATTIPIVVLHEGIGEPARARAMPRAMVSRDLIRWRSFMALQGWLRCSVIFGKETSGASPGSAKGTLIPCHAQMRANSLTDLGISLGRRAGEEEDVLPILDAASVV
jgi:hypothetical protein